jgi:hypothetical protein
MVVDIDQPELHSFLFFGVIIVELHLGQQKLSVVVILNLKIASFGHVSHNFCRVISCFIGLIHS